MVHTFKCLNVPVAVDVNSGAVHVLDEAAYDVLSRLDGPMGDKCPEELYAALPHDRAAIDGAWAELKELQDSGLLFTDDNYLDPQAAVLMQWDAPTCPTTAICGVNTASPPPATSAPANG